MAVIDWGCIAELAHKAEIAEQHADEFDHVSISLSVNNGDLPSLAGALRLAMMADQLAWERGIALAQLEEIGAHFGENMDSFAKVIRCKDCYNYTKEHMWCTFFGDELDENEYCSHGKPREKNNERTDEQGDG